MTTINSLSGRTGIFLRPLEIKCILLCIALAASATLNAQTLRGKVQEAGRQTGLEQIQILNKNSGCKAYTNQMGFFIIEPAKPGDTLIISGFSFKTTSAIVKDTDIESLLLISLQQAPFQLDEIVLSPEINSLEQVSDLDLRINPVNSSQEILRKVPGLFIAQHAGGGKAEQIFLRGFDIDHGTDIAITVDGMPVNMVSHAHGQGYADLHFLIPETVEAINFGKGPYQAEYGNFATGGFVNFRTKERLENSSVIAEYGMFDTKRLVSLVNLTGSSVSHSAYAAGELLLTDGYFESPQDFHRVNFMTRYSGQLNEKNKVSFQAGLFSSQWNASGQIPDRAVRTGLISRFGAIDDTEGGNTGRFNIQLNHSNYISESTWLETRAYYSNYRFDLYSNFTFFLEDPVNGDQIRQKERRHLTGFETALNKELKLNNIQLRLKTAGGIRYDDVNGNELSKTLNRHQVREYLALGNINESNAYVFSNLEIRTGKWLINPAVRADYLHFRYHNLLSDTLSGNQDKLVASPKLNLQFTPHRKWQIYSKNGIGFHSNDTRVVVAERGAKTVPLAFGTDLGIIFKPFKRLYLNTALWYLFLQQEFVYVGDAGIVEPGGRTRRNGIDMGFRYQITDWLFLDADLNYAFARSIDDPAGENYIPLAPDLTSTGGIAILHPSGISGSLRYRYIKDRPANEDNSIIAEGYFVSDVNVNYSINRFTIGIIIENVFNTIWNEAQFATESRLIDESESVEELHFTPGSPFFLRVKTSVRF